MKLLKLIYTGKIPNGIRVQLYNSYKTITLSFESPIYELTDKDINSEAAINYYRINFSSVIRTITDEDKELEVELPNKDEVVDNDFEDLEEKKEEPEIEEDDQTLKTRLDLEVELDDIKNAILKEDSSISFGRKGKSRIINEYFDDYKEVLIPLLSRE